MSTLPGGVWPAMFTPLTENGAVHTAMVEKMVELFLREKLDGVYVLGTTGQGPAMTMEVRKTLTEQTIRLAARRLPVMVHVGAVATEDSIELARHAADAGADAVSAVPPIYFPSTPEVEFEHYRHIASATDLPFLPYCNEIVAGSLSLPVPQYVERLLELPHIVGVKLTTRDMFTFGLVRSESNGRLKLYSGCDELICQGALSGSHGAIGTTYNIFGAAAGKMRRACTEGRFEAARDFMLVYQRFVSAAITSGRFYKFLRQSMQLRHGIDIGPGRAPLCFVGDDWDEDEVRRMCDEVDEAAGV